MTDLFHDLHKQLHNEPRLDVRHMLRATYHPMTLKKEIAERILLDRKKKTMKRWSRTAKRKGRRGRGGICMCWSHLMVSAMMFT